MWFINLGTCCHTFHFTYIRDTSPLFFYVLHDESSRSQRPSKMRHAIILRQFRQWRDAIEEKAEISFTNTKIYFPDDWFLWRVLIARNMFRENSYDPRKYLGRRNLSANFLFRVANINRSSRYTLRTAKLTVCETTNAHPSHFTSLAFCHNLKHFSYNSNCSPKNNKALRCAHNERRSNVRQKSFDDLKLFCFLRK